MKAATPCAIYTRKSSEEGLEQGFNSLDAQREACEAFVLSQKEQGWKVVRATYDDGGFSGGNTERPALQRLLEDIAARRVRIVVVYKVDRLTRSLSDFARMVDLFDAHGVSFVSVTQHFNTTSSMGRLTLNVLLSFAQFEREVTGERIRDKIAASKRKGMWMGGNAPIGYLPDERTLSIDEAQAGRIREIFRLYLDKGSVRELKAELDRLGWVTPVRARRREGARAMGGRPFGRGHLYRILSNPIYIGQIQHKGVVFEGQQAAILDLDLWQAVQDRLATNVQSHGMRSTAANPSLLTGLAFDSQGHRLAPTHTKKGERRYRYYVGQADGSAQSMDPRQNPKVLRWPAKALEDTVVSALGRFLNDESRLLGLMGDVDAREAHTCIKQAKALGEHLSRASSSDRLELIIRLVDRITVHLDRIEILLRVGAIVTSQGVPADTSTTLIEVPVELKRCGLAVRLIVRAPGGATTLGPDQKLVATLAKAHAWFGKLTSGRYEGIVELADEQKVDRSYARRVVYLAFLAPDIVRRILDGDHPPNLNATRLLRLTPLPQAWAEQRKLLGMGD